MALISNGACEKISFPGGKFNPCIYYSRFRFLAFPIIPKTDSLQSTYFCFLVIFVTMKVSVAILSAAMLATPVLARGRGGNGKGKSAVEEEEPTCECVAPFTITLTEYVDTVGNLQPITSIEEAVSHTQTRAHNSPSVDSWSTDLHN